MIGITFENQNIDKRYQAIETREGTVVIFRLVPIYTNNYL